VVQFLGSTSNVTAQTDPAGDVTSYGYDALGRQVTITDPNSGVTTLAYDAAGNQVSLTDADQNTTTMLYDPLNRVVQQIDPLGHSSTYAYDGASRLLSTTDRDGRVRNLSYDSLNRETGESWVVNGSTVNVLPHTYDAYGNITAQTNLAAADPYGYDGMWQDPATGLLKAVFRWYNPATGRWETKDPRGFAGGDISLYRAMSNSPTKLVDPSGLKALLSRFKDDDEPSGPGMTTNFFAAIPPRPVPGPGSIEQTEAMMAARSRMMGQGQMPRPRMYGTSVPAYGSTGNQTFAGAMVEAGYEIKDMMHQVAGTLAFGPGPIGPAMAAINASTYLLEGNPKEAMWSALAGVAGRCPGAGGPAWQATVRGARGALAARSFVNAWNAWNDPNDKNRFWFKQHLAMGCYGLLSVLGGPCFAAGTPLRTPEGDKRIEEFRPGDLVLSRDENNPEGTVEAKRVEAVFLGSGRLVELEVGGQVVRTTPWHPFWVCGKGWRGAVELEAKDLLLGADGERVAVEGVRETFEDVPVYNLRVADWHTYFVGSAAWGFSVWAHNSGGCPPGGEGEPQAPLSLWARLKNWWRGGGTPAASAPQTPGGNVRFNVIDGWGSISVSIENGTATFRVYNIENVNIVIQALNRARAAGATRGTMFTGDVIAPEIANMHIWRAQTGTTWLGGRVTRLADGPQGPQFRIDWDTLPDITQ
jgi:RHS repeat-associated protein